ncbi:chemotaxis-specific protein-glutamate methyltransferase CheB [Roseiconus lacunae]|uniref:Protein-glutamate methylesterase/protein-glutamine glutaminase n=1 Tax=Roseiconus lacunae TaxID=2605694 RepID=A0ABT7PKM7_9BACT|nr:chemotaxis-specific protein-glutamate methyltransferase CheB [Roseiconus lacunae]MDM4017020.1 chemotaxis-specific protein-glutamate methyltransferase CheB [Roseiconus lacunae]
MTQAIRVMVCDDSSMMRRLLVSTLNSTADIKVVTEAVHGKDALMKLPGTRPDIVIMDVGMPVMDGIETVREIRKVDRQLPIIMFSALTQDGTEATSDAISAGANEFATKPVEAGHISQAVAQLKEDLLPKIYRLVPSKAPVACGPNGLPVGATVMRSPGALAAPANANVVATPPVSSRPPANTARIEVIGIGVSTGGPKALASVVAKLPQKLRVPIFIVQHMPASFTALLAERLAAEQGHSVVEASHDRIIEPGQIVIAPGGFHMVVTRQGKNIVTKLNRDPPIHSCRPAVDPMFRSLAHTFGENCLGVILTGMGIDGTEGARALRERGCTIIAQDKATSVVWGMPGSVVQQGLADVVLPIDKIPLEIDRLLSR